MKKALKIVITGKVQGVFYRDTAHKKAQELGIFGYVINKSDGSVECTVEGDENKLDKFIEWSKMGSSYAKVDSVDVREVDLANYSEFIVKY